MVRLELLQKRAGFPSRKGLLFPPAEGWVDDWGGLYPGSTYHSRNHLPSCIMIIPSFQLLPQCGLITYLLDSLPHNLNFTLLLCVALVLALSYNMFRNMNE